MISVDEAKKIIIENVSPLAPIEVCFEDALDFCLAEDVRSDIDMPPFNRSAMDGYAVIAEDTKTAPVVLKIIENIAAGDMPAKKVSHECVSKIMTGASVPEGADAVVRFEDTEDTGEEDRVKILKSVKTGTNISNRGEDMQIGQIVLHAGMQIRPQEIGILATVGKSVVKVYPAPAVGIISTGNELVNVDEKPSPVQIRNSNSYSLAAQARRMNAGVEILGIAGDRKEDIVRIMTQGLQKDVLILSGGVSMGEYDLVGDVLKEAGVRIYFEKVALRPGKPVIFGKKDKTLIFALPGNPVASLVTFELFIYPAMRKLMGFSSLGRTTVAALLETDISTKRRRREFRPAWCQWKENTWSVSLVEWHGSADLLATTKANCLLIIPEETETFSKGQLIDIILLDNLC